MAVSNCNPIWSQKVLNKAQVMRELTEEIIFVFNLPSTEYVVQDYYCSLVLDNNSFIGHLYITYHYVCFRGLWSEIIKSWTFRQIDNINIGTVGLLNSIDIHLHNGQITTFHFLFQFNEAFTILKYLWKYSPCYTKCNNQHVGGTKNLRVNLEQANQAYNYAQLLKEKGIDMISELNNQGQRLEKIDDRTNQIHCNLDRGERLIKNIESPLAHFLDKHSESKTKLKHTDLKWEKEREAQKINILLKQEDNDLIDSCIYFDHDKVCINAISWNYGDVRCIIIRSRPLHADICFKDNMQRIRLMSSYLQIIVNELVLRGDPLVLFEPNAQVFEYGMSDLTVVENKCGIICTTVRLSDILSDDIDVETKYNVDIAEEKLAQVYQIASDLEYIADQIGSGVETHISHLEDISNKIDSAGDRIQIQTQKVKKINRNI